MKKLIIWDFDGVIADSEKLWVQVWCDMLNKYKNIILTEKEKSKLLVGISDKSRKQRLTEFFPNLVLDDVFLKNVSEQEVYMGTNFMRPIPGVESVMANAQFDNCIATGATREQHAWKMTQFGWIKKYMNDSDFFTVDMVENGKPAPDIFLLAAKTKGYAPQDSIVIGDSINDFIAAKSAKMDFIAFIGAEGNNTLEYRKKCDNMGAISVCSNMQEVGNALNLWFCLKAKCR